VISENYRFDVGGFESDGVYQNSGKMWIDSGDVTINGDVMAGDLTIGSDSEYLTASIDGNVSEGLHFKNVQRLNIAGDYDFSSNSSFSGVILPDGQIPGSYWAHIDSDGIVTNALDGAPLISVGKMFNFDLAAGTDVMDLFSDSQFRLTLFDIADVDDVVWLVNADGGVNNADDMINNFYVRYCNSDGSICVDYPDIANLIQRNIADNGLFRDIYVTFDSSWLVSYIQKIQPVVGGVPGHSDSEYAAAGILDDVIEKQLHVNGFYNPPPSSVLPVIFGGTNLYDMSVALNERMNAYLNQHDGRIYQRFSRLFEARDAEQALGNVVLNEHTYFRNFEDRMIDEFLWNRNRNLNKAWLDIDYGFYNQSVSENIDADGSRFGLSGGFDWRQDNGLILGLSAHFNHLNSDATDSFDIGYLPSESIAGHVDTSVTDNNIGIGAYMMQNLGVSTRLYGNAFLDLHMFDIDRDQNYVSGITGDGTAFSIISEWGLLHDWLNQYITGNLYARVGYNTGLDITEKSAGSDYMDMTSDGYAILTPGYTLTAQKRIYPSSWFQIRPYASVGAEYDVLGAPDQIKYKFAIADKYTDYDVEINPLWINAGAGVELVSATGFQFGLDYRYQHNSDIQLHNFKLSGSYRF
ncbi:MAG: autotransporter outer membrane beta-barrel domain-containing protein, partial [Alphaproteobacteria bacterium]